jgi:hypothetical protein
MNNNSNKIINNNELVNIINKLTHEKNDLIIEKENFIVEINNLNNKINELSQHLKKYTSPNRNKKFYENHKEEIIKKVIEYKEKNKDKIKKPDPEKIKEYNKRAYERRKMKKMEETNNLEK